NAAAKAKAGNGELTAEDAETAEIRSTDFADLTDLNGVWAQRRSSAVLFFFSHISGISLQMKTRMEIVIHEYVIGNAETLTTGYDAGALAGPRVWYNLDTTTPPNRAAGCYTMVFKFSAAGSDSLNRTYEPSIEIQVMDVRT